MPKMGRRLRWEVPGDEVRISVAYDLVGRRVS
jgi:hypothetical protein